MYVLSWTTLSPSSRLLRNAVFILSQATMTVAPDQFRFRRSGRAIRQFLFGKAAIMQDVYSYSVYKLRLQSCIEHYGEPLGDNLTHIKSYQLQNALGTFVVDNDCLDALARSFVIMIPMNQ
jgi:hypothetical protein